MGKEVGSPIRRIIEETRDMFCMAAVATPAAYLLKGAILNPKGKRLKGGLVLARLYAPKFTGAMTLLSACFSTTYFAVRHVRQKTDPWNQITAGVALVALVDIQHYSFKAATRSAILYGPLLGLAIGINLYTDEE